MRRTWRIVGTFGIAVALVHLGCGHHAPPPQPTPAAESDIPLPDWAPKNPSPEFMRAARVLKPLPAEMGKHTAMEVPIWELFGAMSDRQLAEFLKVCRESLPISTMKKSDIEFLKKEWGASISGEQASYETRKVLIPYKTMTSAQRKALGKVIDAWRIVFKGTPTEDLRVHFYKLGAKEDLSNVRILFNAGGGHVVSLVFMVGDVATGVGSFASL